ncbi:MAG: bifunctional oligoribonuclease/PAP phosphatase NrnA [Actinomycetota bacterium]|nr:bifunctional oligoribonuclease/PAP phosphatase NrnA [Actinomycetota bacterium]
MSVPPERQWQQAVAMLTGADRVALACHVAPDGDALGSMLALGAALRSRGTEVVASWGGEPFEVPATYAFLPATDLLVPPWNFPAEPELFVTLDSGSPDRLGTLGDRVRTANCTIVVDHHATNTRYGGVHLVDDEAAATAVLVAELVDRLDVELSQDIAAALYTGLLTDTGSFRYPSATPGVHRLAARLLATGIRHDLISRAIYDTAPFGWIELLGRACATARLDTAAAGGLGLVWTVVEAGDLAASGLGLADVEGVIDVLRVAQEAEVAVVVKADPIEGGWKVSTRSKGAVDVGAVCAALGGGGHLFAAGFTSDDDADTTLARLRAELEVAPHLPT